MISGIIIRLKKQSKNVSISEILHIMLLQQKVRKRKLSGLVYRMIHMIREMEMEKEADCECPLYENGTLCYNGYRKKQLRESRFIIESWKENRTKQ